MVIILIIVIVKRMSNKQKVKVMNDVNEFTENQMCSQTDVHKKWEKSKKTFIEWNSHATTKEKQKMLKTALYYNERYLKDEDIFDYDIQDRMEILVRALDESQLSEIYPDIRAVSSYISGKYWTSYWHEKEFLDYFRKTYNLNDLYDYETFLSVMVVPGSASWRGIKPHVSET